MALRSTIASGTRNSPTNTAKTSRSRAWRTGPRHNGSSGIPTRRSQAIGRAIDQARRSGPRAILSATRSVTPGMPVFHCLRDVDGVDVVMRTSLRTFAGKQSMPMWLAFAQVGGRLERSLCQ